MAKSLRSKWRRKCRAVKRIIYGAKELAVLKKTLGIDESNPNADTSKIAMIGQVVEKKKIPRKESESTEMETDTRRPFNPKTMKDENSIYPVWFHQRKIKRNKVSKASAKAIKKKKAKQKR